MKVIEAPEYLISVPDRQEKKYQDTISLKKKNNKRELYTYEVVSLVKYSGNSTSGHYLAYIKSDIKPDHKNWIQINDSIIQYRQKRPK